MAEQDNRPPARATEFSRAPVSCSDVPSLDEELPPHALPFECIFNELWERRPDDLRKQVQIVFPGSQGKEREVLNEKISASAAAYASLLRSKLGYSYGDADEQLCRAADKDLLNVLHGMNSSALCLSGGGMRSASYCLGTLQGLARFGFSGPAAKDPASPHLLTELDYLSTVSGGGYIGSWLMAWTKRLVTPTVGEQNEQDKSTPASAFRTVINALAGRSPHTSGDPAPRAIRHLRDYTSFLAPKLGLTLDTWALAVIIVRNLLVNWLMILPIFVWFLATVQLLHHGLFRFASLWVMRSGFYVPFGVASLLFIFAGLMAGIRMPSRQAEKLFAARLEPRIVGLVFVGPLGISSIILLAIWLQMRDLWLRDPMTLILWFSISASASFAVIPIIRTRFTSPKVAAVSDHAPWVRYVTGIAASIVSGVILALALYTVGLHGEAWLNQSAAIPAANTASTTILKTSDNTVVDLRVTAPSNATSTRNPASGPARPEVNGQFKGWAADRFILFGFPLVWILLMLASSLFSSLIGEYEADIDREWWARAGGIMMFVLVEWILFQAIVIYAPVIFSQSLTLGKLSGAGLLTGLLGAFGGFSTTGRLGFGSSPKKTYASNIGMLLDKFGLVVPGICFIAMLVLMLLIANFETILASQFPGVDSLRGHIWIWLASLVVGLSVNWAVNINIFSLHGMYRMRLMRAFLGSSNTRRKADKFTGFDERDLIWESEVPYGHGVPLHIINATVNLVGTNETAWTQRKAEGFTFSPLSCGGWRLGYAPTACYGGNRGVSLATAMAISGAAVNPNMGYHSSPLVTLIMTLFNVRLGWWLPNPKYRRRGLRRKVAEWLHVSMQDLMSKKSPRLALGPMINEMLGGTNDTTPYIELTDGGHFDNLGLYEMVLRRCKKIIVVDVGADPKCEFEDLGNALRKIEIDLGVPIEFRNDTIHMHAGTVKTNLRCALADIRYECVDGGACCTSGTLIYIKAVLNGQEPPDVLQYGKTHSSFPHEATTNQFFTESQFESYRHLGSFAIDQIVANSVLACKDDEERRTGGSLQHFFEVAELYVNNAVAERGSLMSNWSPSTSVIPEI
jgi:hypothetical protein